MLAKVGNDGRAANGDRHTSYRIGRMRQVSASDSRTYLFSDIERTAGVACWEE